MPYNTRRKSLSLPSLGIALPGAPRSARSPPSTSDNHRQSPPSKKVKRTHSSDSVPSVLTPTSSNSPPQRPSLRFDETPKGSSRVAAHTPPPSPGGHAAQTKVDTEGIDDTIVVAVIEQLEKTGNRPHLLKELAQVLQPIIPIVESSANPAAIISSRLAGYLKRSWTALSPCPLDKQLVGTHPKRIYYFLTTRPRQPIPVDAGNNGPAAARIISPSLSSAASEENDVDSRSRDMRSPSPELDLSSPDYEDAADPFTTHAHSTSTVNIAHNRRAQSPPLETEEREFTQTATSLQQRRRSQEAELKQECTPPSVETTPDVSMHDIIESEESAARKNSETAAALFGQMSHLSGFATDFSLSSPMVKSTHHIDIPPPLFKFGEARHDHEDVEWSWAMKSPENIELHELDELFDDY